MGNNERQVQKHSFQLLCQSFMVKLKELGLVCQAIRKICNPLSREQLEWIKKQSTGIRTRLLQQPTRYLGQCFSNFNIPKTRLRNLLKCRFGFSSSKIEPESVCICTNLPCEVNDIYFQTKLKNVSLQKMIHKTF